MLGYYRRVPAGTREQLRIIYGGMAEVADGARPSWCSAFLGASVGKGLMPDGQSLGGQGDLDPCLPGERIFLGKRKCQAGPLRHGGNISLSAVDQ